MLKAPRFLACIALVCGALLLSSCAGYGGSKLLAGTSVSSEVAASMGVPAMRWKDADGREQWAYPRGPQTFMVFIGANGRLERIEGVLDEAHFAHIKPGLEQAAVLRLLGPPPPELTAYFERRDELVWEWRFCDAANQWAFFDVMFDATTGVVRSTYQRPDYGWPDPLPDPFGRQARRSRTSFCAR